MIRLIVATSLCLCLSAGAWAQDRLAVGVGAADIIANRKSAVDLRLEYRSGLSLLPLTEPVLALHPWAGVETTSRGSIWGGGGILLDVPLGPFAVVGQLGVGAYGQGNGKPLGSPLEFRSGLELAYALPDASRVAVGFSHMSNAGVAQHNPGTEAAIVTYQIPLGRLLGH